MRKAIRGIVSLLFAAAVGATLAPFWEPPLQQYLQQHGYYDDTFGWWMRQVTSVASIAQERWFSWVAGSIFGLFGGIWLDWILRKRENRPSVHERLAVRAFLLSSRIKEVTGNLFLYSDHLATLSSESVSLMMDFHKNGYPTPHAPDNIDQVKFLKIVERYLDLLAPLMRNGQISEAKKIAESITSQNRIPGGSNAERH